MDEFVIGNYPGGIVKVEGRYMYLKKPFRVKLDSVNNVEFKDGGYLLLDSAGRIQGAVAKESINKISYGS